MSVVQFKPKEPDVPHVTGPAKCLDCKHEWVAMMPFEKHCSEVTLAWLACPACSLMRGRFVNHVDKDVDRWTCTCGNQLFTVTRDGFYCPNCGDPQTGF